MTRHASPSRKQPCRSFFNTSGYFQAQVHSEAQIDDANQLVNITFVVQTGKQARIGSVEVNGPAGPEQIWLLHKMRSLRARFTGALLKTGKPYTAERIKAATSLMKKYLAQISTAWPAKLKRIRRNIIRIPTGWTSRSRWNLAQ